VATHTLAGALVQAPKDKELGQDNHFTLWHNILATYTTHVDVYSQSQDK